MKRVMVLLVRIFLVVAIAVSSSAIANEQGQQISCSVHMPAEFFHGHNVGISVTLDNVPAGMEVVAIYARMEFSSDGQKWLNTSPRMESYLVERGRYFFAIRSSKPQEKYYVKLFEITVETASGDNILLPSVVVGPSRVK